MPIHILYPAQIDNVISIPTAIDSVTGVSAVVVNTLQQAIFAVEGELGVKPSGTYATVRARLDALEALYDDLFITPFTNDLSGFLFGPTVVGLQGRPIANIAPQPGQALVWSGLYWLPLNVGGGGGGGGVLNGDVTGLALSNTVVRIQGTPVSSTPPTSGQALVFNGSQWAPGSAGGGGTLVGDVTGPVGSNTISAFQGTPAFLSPSTLRLNDSIIAESVFGEVSSFYFDSVNNLMWIGSWNSPLVTIVNTTTSEVVTQIGTGFVNSNPSRSGNVRRLYGDSNYVYACSPQNANSRLIAIMSKMTHTLVGYLQVSTAGRDMAPDSSGNLWVTDEFAGQLNKFLASDIATAITNYPTPQSPSGPVISLSGVESCCWDPVDNQIWAATFPGNSPATLWQISSSGTILNTNTTFTDANFSGYHGLAYASGFVWASSHNTDVLKINPATFNNTNTAYTVITGFCFVSGDIYVDPFNSTILVQDQNEPPTITRVHTPSGTASSFHFPSTDVLSFTNLQTSSTLPVSSVNGFPTSGTIYVELSSTPGTYVPVNYTGTSPGLFTGLSGGVGTTTSPNPVVVGDDAGQHYYSAAVAINSSTLWVSDRNELNGLFVFTGAPGSELYNKQFVPQLLEYGSPVIWENNSSAISSQPLRYFNVTGGGFTFAQATDSNGNPAATLNLTPGINVQFVDNVVTGVTEIIYPGGQLTGGTPTVFYTSIPAQIQVLGSGSPGTGQALTPYTFPVYLDPGTGRQVSTAYCLTSTGAISVTMPQASATFYGQSFWSGFGSGFNGSGYWVKVVDDQDDAGNNNITVHGSGHGDLVEDPNSPGTFSASVVLSASSCSVTWEFDGTNWKIVASVYGPSAVSIGLTAATFSGTASTTQGSSNPQRIGSFYFVPGDYPTGYKVFFRVLLETTNASNAANIDLGDVYNILGGGAGAEITGSNLSQTALTATESSVELTALEGLPVGHNVTISIRLWINPTAVGQQATCTLAQLIIKP